MFCLSWHDVLLALLHISSTLVIYIYIYIYIFNIFYNIYIYIIYAAKKVSKKSAFSASLRSFHRLQGNFGNMKKFTKRSTFSVSFSLLRDMIEAFSVSSFWIEKSSRTCNWKFRVSLSVYQYYLVAQLMKILHADWMSAPVFGNENWQG